MKFVFICFTLASVLSQAKSLNCTTTALDYTDTTITINRDGSIGFNGTYLTISSQDDFLSSSPVSLKALTGRASDANFLLQSLVLALAPKGVCTNPDADLLQAFKCQAAGIEIQATGQGTSSPVGSPVSSQTETLQVNIIGNVALTATVGTAPNHQLRLNLHFQVQQPEVGQAIDIEKTALCQIVDP